MSKAGCRMCAISTARAGSRSTRTPSRSAAIDGRPLEHGSALFCHHRLAPGHQLPAEEVRKGAKGFFRRPGVLLGNRVCDVLHGTLAIDKFQNARGITADLSALRAPGDWLTPQDQRALLVRAEAAPLNNGGVGKMLRNE